MVAPTGADVLVAHAIGQRYQRQALDFHYHRDDDDACSLLQRRPSGQPGNQLDRYGVRLAVAQAKRWLNISPSGIPNRGARC